MNCQETEALLHGYVDNELDVAKALQVEQHLADCHKCSAAYRELRELRKAISAYSHYYEPPEGIEKRIRRALVKKERNHVLPYLTTWGWQKFGIACTVLAVAALILIPLFNKPSSDDTVMREIISGHVRSLMVDHLTDVPSSDQHTVKPWFNGKLDFSPEVRDFSSEGYTLIGGRLDYVDGKPAAALVYQRRKHFINLFIWRSASEVDIPEKLLTQQGYNLARWTRSGITYWAISDINMLDLQDFVQAVQRPL